MNTFTPTETETLALTVTVMCKEETLACIAARIHVSDETRGLQLQREFYREPIKGLHHELELVGPKEVVTRRFLHIHHADDGRPFVCYPAATPTLEEAIHLLRVWSAGTMHTIAGGDDLNVTLGEGGGMEKFLDWIEEHHSITTGYALK